MLNAATIARVMGGRVYQGAALVPGPNHSQADRSLRVFPDPDAEGGFRIHLFAGDDPIECRIMCGGKWDCRHGSRTAIDTLTGMAEPSRPRHQFRMARCPSAPDLTRTASLNWFCGTKMAHHSPMTNCAGMSIAATALPSASRSRKPTAASSNGTAYATGT